MPKMRFQLVRRAPWREYLVIDEQGNIVCFVRKFIDGWQAKKRDDLDTGYWPSAFGYSTRNAVVERFLANGEK